MKIWLRFALMALLLVPNASQAHQPSITGHGDASRSDSLPALARENMTLVTGKVLERHTGNPMHYANIFVQGTTKTTYSDAQGNFTMRVPVHAVLTISHVGYVTERKRVGLGGTLQVALRKGVYHIPLPEIRGGYYASTSPTRTPRRYVRTEQGGYAVLEQMPNFTYGGYTGLALYLHEKAQKVSIIHKEEGNVNVGFTLSKSASVSNAHIIQSDNPALNEQAINIIKGIEGWIPGVQRGQPVDVRVSMMVRFSIPQ